MGHPGQRQVEEQQVAEEPDGAILAGGDQDGRGEAAHQAEQRHGERGAAHRVGDGHRRHQGQQGEGGQGREQVPEGVGGEDGGEEDGHAGAGQRLGRDRVPPGRPRLGAHQQAEADRGADGGAHRRAEPAVLDGPAQEGDGGDEEGDAGDPGEELHADEGLEVEVEGGARRGGRRARGERRGSSGDWSRNADIHDLFKYKESVTGNPYFEPVTYQSYGEIHALDKSETENLLQGFKPTYLNIGPNAITGGDFSILKQVAGRSASGVFVKYPTVNTSGKRIPRNISIQHFTNEQLNVEDNILKQFDIKYTTNVNESYNLNELNKLVNRDALPPRQTGGFEAVNTSGLRYIYGMPAYNLSSTECTYSAAKISGNEYKVDCIDNGSGDPVAAPAGYEDYLEKEELPAYAHSYLLTSVLGSDYIDMDDNGVSDKDLGYWVKFNYLKTNGNESEGLKPYNWRAPYKGGNYNEKLQSKDRDDVGTYTFGKRENFYVTSIETKTHVAEFYLSPRHDARGAEKEIQSLNFNPSNAASSYKLDSIRLFTKPERYDANGAIIPNAIPIKTVHFEYANYPGRYASAKELCKGPDNAAANTGKLTLKSVWFSYRNNAKGKDNNYVFDYHEGLNNENPDYNPFDYNRWGDYQPNDPDYCENKYFPYTRQDLPKAEIDRRAAVWNLKEIELPTGASMKINYEANDHAYVQNKPAMQMYKIASVGNTDGIGHAQQLYNWNSDSVYFELPATVSSLTEAKNTVKNYLDNTGQLYFKTKVDLTARGDWEYVSGYCKIDNTDAVQVGTQYYGILNLSQAPWNCVSSVISRPWPRP